MTVEENLNRILKEIKNYKPRLIAVTKYYDENKMIEAYNAGIRDFAENKVMDAIRKIGNIDDTIKNQSLYHFIGHLQTNKVKHVVGTFQYIHSVDSLKLAKCINDEANKKGIIQKVLIQVNNANEPQKYGIEPCNLEKLINDVSKMQNVELVGLMNIAPLTDDIKELNKLFSNMKELQIRYGLKELSMGMSHDYKIALENGATMIRLGRILFKEEI